MFKGILTKLYFMIFKVLCHLPKRQKTIVFESFSGKQFSDNPRAIYMYMKEHHPEYKLYWSFDRREYHSFKVKVRYPLYRFGLKWLFVMPRASYWITNSRLPAWIPKPIGTTYIQTWHGTPLKKLGVDIDNVQMPGTTTETYKTNFTNETKKWDVLVSPNEYSTNIFKQAFKYENKIIESGYPRNDILYTENNEQAIHKLKVKLQLPEQKKVLLYAPTWRDNEYYSIGNYKLSLELDLQQMKDELEGEYVVLIRAHYLVSEELDLSDFKGFAYDVSAYGDISELYLVADLLITDYSSVFFDYANLKRPILFFTHDIEEYRDQLRGFYFDLEVEAPGPLVETTEEIVKEIKKIESKGFEIDAQLEKFYHTYCSLEDGKASERVVQYILEKK